MAVKVSELIEQLSWMPVDDEVVDSFTNRKIENIWADGDKKVTYLS